MVSGATARFSDLKNFEILVAFNYIFQHNRIKYVLQIIFADIGNEIYIATLPETECNIVTLVAVRLLCATHEKHIYEAVTTAFKCV